MTRCVMTELNEFVVEHPITNNKDIDRRSETVKIKVGVIRFAVG